MWKFQKLAAAATMAALFAAGTPALAECPSKTGQTAQQANKEIVANSKTDPETGQKEAATGPAKPTENWFGCQPGEKRVGDKCESAEGKDQEKKAEAPKNNDITTKSQTEAAAKTEDCPETTPKG